MRQGFEKLGLSHQPPLNPGVFDRQDACLPRQAGSTDFPSFRSATSCGRNGAVRLRGFFAPTVTFRLTASGCNSLLARHLVVDPGIGPLDSVAQTNRRLPAEILLNQSVIAVPAVDTFRSAKIVAPL